MGKERELVLTFLSDINSNFGVKLDPYPSLKYGLASLDTNDDDGRILVIGSSHISRMACHMQPENINLAEPGYTASQSSLLGHGPYQGRQLF
jgi:hypothetical protein